MAVYTVHQAPSDGRDRPGDPSRLVLVRDGFHFWALVFAPLWMIRRGLWWVFLGYVLLAVALQAMIWALGIGGVRGLLFFLLHLLIGFEAGTLRRWTLTRRGWRSRGAVVARNRESAEWRVFESGALTPAAPALPGSFLQPRRDDPGIIGLFPEPDLRR